MNTQEQQATLYRKAAETIEMCAEHGIDAKCKYLKSFSRIEGMTLIDNYEHYEFPIAVIEEQLVWADTIVYNRIGLAELAKNMHTMFNPYTLAPPKQPLCEVEGKPVYKGDILYCKSPTWLKSIKVTGISESGLLLQDSYCIHPDGVSWNQPKRTVMVELLVEDVEAITNKTQDRLFEIWALNKRFEIACQKSLDNLKGS